jgi:hypothetical protein
LIKGFIEFLKFIRTRVACIVIDEAVFVLSFPGQGQAGTDGQHIKYRPDHQDEILTVARGTLMALTGTIFPPEK